MKITKIDVIKPRFGNFIKATGCRVYTDEGIYGDGEASLNTGTGAEAGFAQIVDYAPLLIGMDPLCTEMIWDRPTAHSGPSGERMGGLLHMEA